MVLPSACAGVDKPDNELSNFKYSLNTSTISGGNLGIEKYIEIAASAGYDFIEIWVRDLETYINSGNSINDLRNLTNDLNIGIVSAIGFAPWMTGGKEGFDQMQIEMEMLAEVGCSRIAAPPAGVDPHVPLDLFEVGKKYAELLELGRQTGVIPQLEFWGSSPSLWHIGQAMMIVAVANDADARILPDVYHMFRGGSGFDTLKMISGNMIDMFHVNDYPGDIQREEQTDADRVFPGDGIAPLNQIIQDLGKDGGEKVLSLELFNRDYWKRDPAEIAATGLEKMKSIVKSAGAINI